MKTDKLTIEFLNPENCVFSFNSNGFLVMTLDGEEKGRIKLIRTYPYSLTDEYICVHDIDDKEIGIIRNLNDLDKSSCENAKKELEDIEFSEERIEKLERELDICTENLVEYGDKLSKSRKD